MLRSSSMNEESSGTYVPCVFVLGLINSDLGSKTLIEAYLETGVVY